MHLTGSGRNLSLDAKKDIINLGADMKAGGSASLVAGNDIKFDTIEKKSVTTTSSFENKGVLRSEYSHTTTTKTEQVRSGLSVGGNLSMKAGNDITLAGVEGNVGGNASLNAGGNVNLVGRENTTTTKSHSVESGLGVGGGVGGTREVKEDAFSSRNVGTNLNVGGNVNVDAQNINVLAGRTSTK